MQKIGLYESPSKPLGATKVYGVLVSHAIEMSSDIAFILRYPVNWPQKVEDIKFFDTLLPNGNWGFSSLFLSFEAVPSTMGFIKRIIYLVKRRLISTFPKVYKIYMRFSLIKDVPEYLYANNAKKIQIHKHPEMFARVASEICQDGNTFLREDRLYTLFQILKQLEKNTSVVEVGVYKGGSVKFISRVLSELKIETQVYACDTFSGHSIVDVSYDGDHKVNAGFSDVRLVNVQEYLRESDVKIIVGDIHHTFAEIPGLTPIGLLHIDVDVYPTTKFCLEQLGRKVSNGGFIVCDDYGFTTCQGAKRAVDDFCAENPEWRMVHLLTGQALMFRTVQ